MACVEVGTEPSGVAAALIGGSKLVDCTQTICPEAFGFVSCFKGVETCEFDVTDGNTWEAGSKVNFTQGRFDTTTIFDTREKPEGYRKCIFRMACDVGTHIDSPAHWFAGKRDIADLTLQELTAPGAVVDLTAKVEVDPDYRLSVADLTEWEATFGQIPAQALVVMKTGWGARFAQGTDAYLNDNHFPGFSAEAATFLVNERDIVGIGIDTGSLDYGLSADFIVHQIILGADKYQIENMLLEDVPAGTNATFISLPIKVKGGPEAETRVMAVLK